MMNSLGVQKAPKDTRVVVAMSGGVDSSVVAAMLHAEGYDVLGITLQLYDHGDATHRKGSCCAGQDIHDAKAVADRLNIPHYVLDYESRFKAKVIEDFAASYAKGETPIPCVACNQHIKFADLFDTALELGADVLATGHYISSRQLETGQLETGESSPDTAPQRALYRALDAGRDQSYFLFATTQDQLKLLRFPLGDLPKPEVRELARKFGLAIADKADSQDICFVPTGKYSAIIERLKPEAVRAGDVVHIDGRVLGRHDGIINFTIGQRRGLGIAASEPLFVIKLDAANARVIVGPREALATRNLTLRDVNWLGDQPLNDGDSFELHVRVRSTRAPVPARVMKDHGEVRVELLGMEDGISPGQACAFYENGDTRARVLGGGFIAATSSAQTSSPHAPVKSPELVQAGA